MTTGQIISGVGHAALILWAVLGGAFRSEPLPFEVTEVTAISAEEYAALIAPERVPDAVASVDTPDPPATGTAPDLASQADAPLALNPPRATDATPPDAAPETPDPVPPAEAEVTDTAPVLQPPPEDTAVLLPEAVGRPVARPAPRVAPEPVARPEPDVEIDDVDRAAAAPDDTAEPVEEDRRETAREEAATRIVTEAEEAAPSRSLRPRARPRTAAAETEETAPVDSGAVEDAIAAALGGAAPQPGTETAPAGPPLTAGEKDALRVAVEQCWNVGSLSTEALGVTVVVGVTMTEDGRPDVGSIRMLSSSGGSAAAAERAFDAARRAIIRCGTAGYDLPPEKYDRWRDIEMTFNPEKMRIK